MAFPVTMCTSRPSHSRVLLREGGDWFENGSNINCLVPVDFFSNAPTR